MRKKIVSAVMLPFVFLFIFKGLVFGQQTISGTYVLSVGGQTVSEENYTSEKLADGSVKVVSKIGTAIYITRTRNDKPLEFSIEANGAKALTAVFAPGEAKISIGGEQPEKIIKIGATALLENGVWTQYTNLLAQYDRKQGGVQNFAGFLPSQLTGLFLTLEKAETKSFKLKDRAISLAKFNLLNTKSNLRLEIWADETNTPLLIEIPAQQAQIVKKGFEELREMTAPAKVQLKNFTGEFTSEEVSFPNGGITLAGTLALPKNNQNFFPAIVIISGSGGQDRDGSQLFNLYKEIAESLSQAGIAVLRVDDRGIGKSTILKEKAAETSYRDLISDSRAAFDYLTTRKEIDKNKIALLGHSEGAETALTIAAEDKRVAAIILLAGTSRPLDRGVAEQEIYQRALQETVNAADKTKVMPLAQTLMKQFTQANLPQNAANPKYAWFREHLASDPSVLATKVKCPVLIVQGERDALVLAYHSIESANAFVKAGNKNVSLRIIPNATHIFTPVTSNAQEASKISAEMLLTLQNWATTSLSEISTP